MESNEWLEDIRGKQGITQEEVAKRAGISRNYYTMIASGSRRPSVLVAKNIAKALEFDWTIFFDEKSNESLTNYTT